MPTRMSDSTLSDPCVVGAEDVARAGRQWVPGSSRTFLDAAFYSPRVLSPELVVHRSPGSAAWVRKASRRIAAICRRTYLRRGRGRFASSDRTRRGVSHIPIAKSCGIQGRAT